MTMTITTTMIMTMPVMMGDDEDDDDDDGCGDAGDGVDVFFRLSTIRAEDPRQSQGCMHKRAPYRRAETGAPAPLLARTTADPGMRKRSKEVCPKRQRQGAVSTLFGSTQVPGANADERSLETASCG